MAARTIAAAAVVALALGPPPVATASSSSAPAPAGGLLSDPGAWVRGQIGGLEHEAVQGAKIVSNATSTAVSTVGHDLGPVSKTVGDSLATVGNTTGSLAGSLADKGKRAAIGALLWSSGKCPSFIRHLPEVPRVLAPLLARGFQADAADPSISQAACARSAVSTLATFIDHLGNESESDKTVLKWIAFDRSSKVCNEQLLESLRTMEPIRQDYADQYRMAVADRLLLDVVTEEALFHELGKFCGEDQAEGPYQEGSPPAHLRGASRLYEVRRGAVRSEGVAAASASSWDVGSFALLGGLGALLAALPVGLRVAAASTRRSSSHTGGQGLLGHAFVRAPVMPDEASRQPVLQLPAEEESGMEDEEQRVLNRALQLHIDEDDSVE